MNTKQTLKGFTIIEVVLVLAIAGLIFLMVFIALPALQSGQRDTARKNDASIVASAVTNSVNNNRGKFPDTAKVSTELGTTTVDGETTYSKLSSNITSVVVVTGDSAGNKAVADGEITVYKGLKCNGTTGSGGNQKAVLAAGSARQLAITTKLEGGSGAPYCLDS
jgi:prepilin-type N-terminal cleavage/methylation domain-containing protein